MATTARLDLSVWRNDDVYEFPLRVRGPSLVGITMRAQVRLAPDTPGAPLVNLSPVDNGNAEGIRLVSVTQGVDGVYVNDVRIRINKSTRQALPYSGETGDPSVFAWAFQIAGRTRLVGDFRVLAHTMDSNAAPASRPASYSVAGTPRLPSGGATLAIAQDDVAELIIDGADLIGEFAGQAAASAASAAEDAEEANLALTSVLAASNYFPSKAEGEAATGDGDFFSYPDGAGNLVYAQGAITGSVIIGYAATAARLNAVEASVERTIALKRVAPSGTVAASTAGAGNLTGTYAWRVTYVTATGETEGSVASNVLTLNNQAASLTGLAISPDPLVTGRRIYRTRGNEPATERGKLVVQINDNTTTTYLDNVADADLGQRLPWINTTGGALTLNGQPYFGAGLSTRFGINCLPLRGNYACTAMGANAMGFAEEVLRTEAFGIDALQNIVTGEGLVAIGTHAIGGATSGKDTIALGYGALQSATYVEGCIAIGRAALSDASGSVVGRTAVGAYSLQQNTIGNNNTAFGYQAGYGVVGGNNNCLFGFNAGATIGGGDFNCYFGMDAGKSATGASNCGFGFSSLSVLTTGIVNAAYGIGSGSSLTTGSYNTFIGPGANTTKPDVVRSIAIGFNAVSTRDREIVLGNATDNDFIVIMGVSFTKAQIQALRNLVP